ncbi:MAG: hypothetical protein AAFQ07_11780, partial [Chloroflexota bacterium]
EDLKTELTYILNWLDWLGYLVESRAFKNPYVLYNTLGFQLRRVINLSQRKIEFDTRKHGVGYWGGVEYLSKELGIEWIRNLKKSVN